MNRDFGILKLAVTVAVVAFTAVGCGKNSSKTDDSSSTSKDTSSSLVSLTPTITVANHMGMPVANARVMIGMRENVPFPGNVLTTDANGKAVVPEKVWTEAQPVTIEAPGYVRVTYFDVMPEAASLQLRPLEKGNFELKGNTVGFGDLKKDGFADVGLVFRALPRSSVATFDVMALLSTEIDTISVMGQNLDLPSNVTLPKQTENYILPITLNKPQYRTFFPSKGSYQVVATHARFPFKKTIDDMRGGKSIFDLINVFEFREGTVKQFDIANASHTSDVTVDGVEYVKSIPFTATKYDAGFNLLAIAGAEVNGMYYPTDVKSATSSQKLMLASPKTGAGNAIVIAALRRADAGGGAAGEEISSVILPANSSIAYDFLPMPKAPSYISGTLKLDAPSAPTGVAAVLTYGVMNKITVITKGKYEFEQKTPQWEVYAPAFASSLQLPQMPALSDSKTADKLRWEVLFAGQFDDGSLVPAPGPAALERVSHVSRSAVDL